MKQADWQDVVQIAQLRADTFERKAGIKRRYYERQLGMMKVMALTLTLTLTLPLALTQTKTLTLNVYRMLTHTLTVALMRLFTGRV